MLRKRQAKRLIRKVLYFLAVIGILSYVTSLIVEKRLERPVNEPKFKNEPQHVHATDMNGDPVTPTFMPPGGRATTNKPPRPPVQERVVIPPRALKERAKETKRHKFEQQFAIPVATGPKKDWENRALIEEESKRVGLGEHGMPAYVLDESMKELEANMSMENGFNALLSDMISVNRSIPDVRLKECRSKLYLSKLPTVSIVIPFFNEHFSVLLRTLHSIVNRTPPELLMQIIIVDDGSHRPELKDQLEDYVFSYFPDLIIIVRQSERTGLIAARLAGAQRANGDVLIFFDSHIECNQNWLPPLLEPIAVNPKVSTCPIVDTIDHANFAYSGGYQMGARGAFDWDMLYKQLPLEREEGEEDTEPYHNPIMMGGLFAIGREFFWELGGYDEGLEIWGGEQYELSFKIWMCGGMLLDVPCSRVGHIFRGPMAARPSPRNYSFVARNHMRVAEVWMDDYKQYMYKRNPALYKDLEPGNLTAQHDLRKQLNCKSFQWFLEQVAPDMLAKFPPVPPPDYAYGAVQSAAYPQYCLDTLNGQKHNAVGLYYCAENKTHPHANQNWALSFSRDLRNLQNAKCLDVHEDHTNASAWMWSCHHQGGNQFWYYDRKTAMLVHGRHGKSCLEAVVEGDQAAVYANPCQRDNVRMKWIFGNVNDTALDAFYEGLI